MGDLRRASVAMGVSIAMLLTACGGGDGDDSLGDLLDGGAGADDGGLDDDVIGDIGDAADSGSVDGGDGGSVEVVGAPTLTADPGTAVVEVDGERIEYVMAGSINLVCDVSDEMIQVNIQTPEGQSFLLQASTNAGPWFASMTAGMSGSNVQYGSDMIGGVLGIGDDAISYEGPMTKVVDRDILNAEDVSGTLAINCASPGGDPSAMVGDQSFTFPISGAQSFECEVTPEEFEIRVNRLALDGTQLEMQGRFDGSQWLGNVTVYTDDGNIRTSLPPDGAGLTVDGSSVTFEGTFELPDGTESPGSAEATC